MNQRNYWKPMAVALMVIVAVAGMNLALAPSRLGPRSAKADLSQTLPGNLIPEQSYKILHVMSYHSSWKWPQDQLAGFQKALADLEVEYQILEMDTKRKSSEAWKEQITNQANELILQWQPDLVFTSDDSAQTYITRQWINTEIPFVFCGVNATLEEHAFLEAYNITGVLERLHFIQTIKLLKDLDPTVQRIAILSDHAPMWAPIIERLKTQVSQLNGVEVVGFHQMDTYAEYQEMVLAYQETMDALGLLGVFEYSDDNGNNVPIEILSRWTAENSNLPDFSFWRDRVDHGTLCAMTVSGHAQGEIAGHLARKILVENARPDSLPFIATSKGIPVINLGRAKKLGLKLQASTLLTAEFVKDLP